MKRLGTKFLKAVCHVEYDTLEALIEDCRAIEAGTSTFH